MCFVQIRAAEIFTLCKERPKDEEISLRIKQQMLQAYFLFITFKARENAGWFQLSTRHALFGERKYLVDEVSSRQ